MVFLKEQFQTKCQESEALRQELDQVKSSIEENEEIVIINEKIKDKSQ